MIRLAFDIMRVDMPCLDGCDSRKVWNHVGELRMDTQTLSRLARNGLRVGVAIPDSWPAIETIMEATDASISRLPEATLDRLLCRPDWLRVMLLSSRLVIDGLKKSTITVLRE